MIRPDATVGIMRHRNATGRLLRLSMLQSAQGGAPAVAVAIAVSVSVAVAVAPASSEHGIIRRPLLDGSERGEGSGHWMQRWSPIHPLPLRWHLRQHRFITIIQFSLR